jgi:hypothetical protein
MKTFFIILISGIVNAQNLVQNPSFELFSGCPTLSEQINLANNWGSPPNNTGSPDYYNSCNTQNNYSVPNNLQGIQQAYNGNAYVGIVIYYDFYLAPDYREYIQTQLSTPLVAGQTYLITFHVSLSENSRLASNNIGAIFTINQLNGDGGELPISITPSILEQNIITNTAGWTQISGTYTATGGEQYLTIGNFFYNNQTQTQISNATLGFISSYYFIDNVSVTQTLGQKDFIKEDVVVFPNPTSDIFSIASKQNEIITTIELHSQYEIIKNFDPSETVFDIKDLSTGIYYLFITFESGKKILSKVIKK